MAKKSFYKIEMLFLKVLEQEDCYGYQLTQSIQDITNGQIKIAEGTMYPILYKLQDNGYFSDRQVKVGKTFLCHYFLHHLIKIFIYLIITLCI